LILFPFRFKIVVVILVKPTGNSGERRLFISVGYGLEGAITDLQTKHIRENEIVPYFKQQQFYQGLEAGCQALMLAAKGEYNEKTASKQNGLKDFISNHPILFLIFVIIVVLILFKGGGRSGGGGITYFGGGSSFGGFSGGGGGGSSFGGFGGGDRKQLVYSHILEAVSSSPKAGFLMVGYDDLYAIQYFKDNRMAYWKHNGKKNIRQAFEESAKEYRSVMERCRHFDTRLMEDAEKAGGKEYAELCAIAYRQAVAAHKLIEDKDGNLLFLSKENFSNGSIGTVDVTYPSAPLFLLYNPELLKGMLNPIFHYSESGRWNKPFAAHDVGTYPHANGQTYPFDMPVEECGNMLILTTAIALREGNADYAREHWKTLGVWANYLLC
jgi:hypothetical protein